VVLAFITSRVAGSSLRSDLILDANDPDFPATGLRASSVLQLHRLMTVTTSLIRRELGEIPQKKQSDLAERLKTLFGLDAP
jgi:mRNA interferase MazF